MKKTQSLLLISTLIAPMMLGTAGVSAKSAEANPPKETLVRIHAVTDMNATAVDRRDQHDYWGNGGIQDLNKIVEDNSSWEPTVGATYEAFALPTGTVTYEGEDMKPVINDTFHATVDGKEWRWTDILKPVRADKLGAATTNLIKKDGNISPWTIEIAGGMDVRKAVYALTDLDPRTPHPKAFKNTDAQGLTEMSLAKGQWVIAEDLEANMKSTASVPMFIDIPMIKPDAKQGGEDFWYDNTQADALNLYAKQYDPTTLKVKKTDKETGKALAGAQVLVTENTHEEQLKKVLPELLAAIKKQPKDAAKLVEQYVPKLKTGNYAIRKTDKSGEATFSSDNAGERFMTPGHTYAVVELAAPTGYIVEPQIQDVELSMEKNPADKSLIQGQGKADFIDYDELQVDKSVTIGDKTYGAGAEDGGDTEQGVAKGTTFQWHINSELNQNVDTYSQYELVDTLPYQNDWRTMTLNLTYQDASGALKTTSLLQMTANGMNTGAGTTYTTNQNGVNGITYNAATAPTVTALGDAMTADGIELSGSGSRYAVKDGKLDASQSVADGTIMLSVTETGRKQLAAKMAELLASGAAKDGTWQLSWNLDVVANQGTQPGEMVNKVDLNYKTAFDQDTDSDTAKTFVKGSGTPTIHDTPTKGGGVLPYTAGVMGIGLTILGLLGLAHLLKKRRAED